LKKALEIEKKNQNIDVKNNDLKIAQTVKIKADLNTTIAQNKLKANEM
jgi:hypothetical protein